MLLFWNQIIMTFISLFVLCNLARSRYIVTSMLWLGVEIQAY